MEEEGIMGWGYQKQNVQTTTELEPNITVSRTLIASFAFSPKS